MKAIITLITGTLLATGAVYGQEASSGGAGVEIVSSADPGQYCARMRDGKMVVLFDGKEITGDVFLKNGTTVKADGTVISKDGVRFSLKEGQCIDQNGVLIGETMKEPYKEE